MIEEQERKELLTVSTNDLMDKYREKYNQAEFDLAVKDQQIANLLKKIEEQEQRIGVLKVQVQAQPKPDQSKAKPVIDGSAKEKDHKNK